MKAVARQLRLDLQSPMSADQLGNLVQEMLLTLARAFSVRGIVPGHIKALVKENKSYCSLSCTKPGRVNRDRFSYPEKFSFHRPYLYLNVVLVGVPEEDIVMGVDSSIENLLSSVRGCPDHQKNR